MKGFIAWTRWAIGILAILALLFSTLIALLFLAIAFGIVKFFFFGVTLALVAKYADRPARSIELKRHRKLSYARSSSGPTPPPPPYGPPVTVTTVHEVTEVIQSPRQAAKERAKAGVG